MLRNYAKLCEKEGIVSDRVHVGSKSDDDVNTSKLPKKKEVKPSPFLKAELMAKSVQEEKQQLIDSKVSKEEAIKMAEKRRKDRTKLLNARTRKGQPFLSKYSTLLLDKITSKLQK